MNAVRYIARNTETCALNLACFTIELAVALTEHLETRRNRVT